MPEKNIAAIMMAVRPTKQEYVVGFSSLDLDGGLLNIVYEDSSFDQIPLSDKMEYAVNNSRVGTAVVTVKYCDFTTTFPITIRHPKLERVTIITPPQKTAYLEGEAIDLTGLRLMGHFDNGEEKELSDIPVPEHTAKMGEAVIPISIENLLIPILIRVSPIAATKISILSAPTKTTFSTGDNLDLTGCTLKVTYSDGREEVIDIAKAEIRNFNPQTPGKQTLTISYSGQSCTLEVNVAHSMPEKIEISRLPNKRVYVEGEKYSIKGMELIATSNGSAWPLAAADVEIIDTHAKLGDTMFRTLYQNIEIPVPVTVQKKRLKFISIDTLPAKVEYKEGSESLDMTGAALKLLYNNGDTEIVPITNDMVKGFDNSTPKTTPLSVEYEGLRTQFDVAIIPKKLTGIVVSSPPEKTDYTVGEMFDPTGMVVTAYYDNGASASVERYLLSQNLPLKLEDTIITITYLDMTATLTITVKDTEPEPEPEHTPATVVVEPEPVHKIELPKAPVFYPPTFSLRFLDDNP